MAGLLIALKWPLTVVVIVGIIIFALRSAIARLVDRISEVDWGTRKVRAGGTPQQSNTLPEPGAAPPQLLGDPAVEAAVVHIRREMQLERIPDPAERERRLLQLTAQASLSWLCERTYRMIFGSQIRALQSMNVTGPVPREVVQVDYDIAARGNSELYDRYPFDSWFGFLTGSGLIVVQDDLVHITDFGRVFLVYMVQQGLETITPN
jgi:hypothetical protein